MREVWNQSEKPTEAPNDPYSLTVTWGPPQTGWEIEPNDWEAAATPVPPGTSMRGFIGDPEDKDFYVVTPATSGALHVHVTAPDGVDIVLLHPAAGKDAASKHLTTNKVGPGEDEEATWIVTAGEPTLLGVTRKLPRGDLKDADLGGFDAPYELRAVVELPR